MAVRKVVSMGHPILREVAKPVPEDKIQSDEIKRLIEDMTDTMFDYNGLGLAAPQVAESLQIVVMLWGFEEDPSDNRLMVLINPKVTALTEQTSRYWEGCLSVPGLRGLVARPNRIRLEALTPNLEKIDQEITGFAATVVQHECDHLLGKLYVDRIEDMRFLAFEKEYQRYLSQVDSGESDT